MSAPIWAGGNAPGRILRWRWQWQWGYKLGRPDWGKESFSRIPQTVARYPAKRSVPIGSPGVQICMILSDLLP